jgi:hypothetical protein
MLADIRRVGGINLYFPYLDPKNGKVVPLRNELAWLIAYALFADKILFPPRSIFSGEYAVQNLADLTKYPSLRSLIDAGVLITTATDPNIRDLNDLFERYSGLIPRSPFSQMEFSIYARDEDFQRHIASEYIVECISKLENFSPLDKQAVIAVVKKEMNHSRLVLEVSSALEGTESGAKSEVSRILSAGYFFAGAKGNAAITPPVIGEQPHDHFEFFYSKSIIGYFASEFQKRLKRPLSSITPDELQRARSNLSIFREQYLLISTKHRKYFREVASLLAKSHPGFRLRAPILGLQASAATSIGLALSPVFGMAAFGIAATGKFAWEALSKGLKVNDRISEVMRNALVKVGVLEPYTKDLLEALESFDKAAKLAIDR